MISDHSETKIAELMHKFLIIWAVAGALTGLLVMSIPGSFLGIAIAVILSPMAEYKNLSSWMVLIKKYNSVARKIFSLGFALIKKNSDSSFSGIRHNDMKIVVG